MSLIAYFHDNMFHIYLVHSPHLLFSHDFVFMSMIWALWTLSVGYHVSFMFHEKHFCFIPYLKDFVLVYKFFHLTSCGILRYGRVFKHILFSNLFLKTPTIKGRLVGRPCLVCSLLKIHFKHVHEMGGRKYELYTWSYYSFNWYHWILSIGINNDTSFCILIYIFDLCLLYLYIFEHKLCLW